MAYTSVIAATKRGLVDLLDGSVTWQGQPVTVAYSWSPGTTDSLAIFATRPVIEGDEQIEVPVSYELPVMQPGAQPFNETFRVDLTMWAFRPDLTSDELETAETQICSLVGQTLELLADNTSLGGAMWSLPDAGGSHRVQAYEKGWAVYRVIPLEVVARLQP